MTNSYKKYLFALAAILLLNGSVDAMKRSADYIENDNTLEKPVLKRRKVELTETEGMILEEEIKKQRNVFQQVLEINVPLIRILMHVLRDAKNITEIQDAIMNLRLVTPAMNKKITNFYLSQDEGKLNNLIISLAYLINTVSITSKFNNIHTLIRLLYNLSESDELLDRVVLTDMFNNILNAFNITPVEFHNLYKKQTNSPSSHLQKRLLILAQRPNQWRQILNQQTQLNEQLIYASYTGNDNEMNNLFQQDADIYYESQFTHTTPFFAAIEGNQPKIVRQFLLNSDLLERPDQNGSTPLMTASQHGHRASKEKESIIEILITDGANIDTQDNLGMTALIIAAKNGLTKTVQTLINAGANINLQNNIGITALIVAAYNGHTKTVQTLIQAGANINLQSNLGLTALMVASQNGNNDTVQTLTNAGADINLQDHLGWTALIFAAHNRHNDIVQTLIRSYPPTIGTQNHLGWNALMIAVQNGYSNIAQTLIKAYADINLQSNLGLTALMIAARYGHNNIAQTLIKAYADINLQSNLGLTALMFAAHNGNDDTVQILLQAGADIDAQNNKGWTALIWADSGGHNDTVQLLIDSGADINLQTNNGWTILNNAVKHHKKTLVEILLNTNQLSIQTLQHALQIPSTNLTIKKLIQNHLTTRLRPEAFTYPVEW